MAEQNFLNLIRETEQQAADIISQARENARLRQDEAHEAAAGMISRAREEASLLQKQLLAEAEAEAKRIADEADKQSRASAAGQTTEAAGRLAAAARMVAERIVSENAHR